MKKQWLTWVVVLAAITPLSSQLVASHAPTQVVKQPSPSVQLAGKPVARVNGAVLTDRDLMREMYTIFPYARQHNGFPKEMEGQIRSGAMQMIIFEELVYQEAVRRNMTVPLARLQRAEAEFRAQFSTPEEYQQVVNNEFHGSQQMLRDKIRRSLLIEALLKTEVEGRSVVSLAEVKDYYDKNPARFEYQEAFAFQTISVLPPAKATPEQLSEGRKRADDALRQAKATKNYEEFGMLAEKISDDDYRVMMGDHKAVDRGKLGPIVLDALQAMQPGQVSDVIQIERAYTILRLNQHIPAGKRKFEEVKDSLQQELTRKKTNDVRVALDKKLRQNAKIEVL